jgi:hypothetical protein
MIRLLLDLLFVALAIDALGWAALYLAWRKERKVVETLRRKRQRLWL